jgi:hypothetical protein
MMKMTKSIPIAIDFMEGSVSEYLDNLWAKKSFIVANIWWQLNKTFSSLEMVWQIKL